MHSAIEMLPRIALGFAAGYMLLVMANKGEPFPSYLLPFLLLTLPLAMACSYWLQAKKQPSLVHETAEVLDRNLHSKDRLSTALEFSETEIAEGEGRSAILARAAIADGIAWLPKLDTSRTEVKEPDLPWRWRPIITAVLITLLPVFLTPPTTQDGSETDPAQKTQTAGESSAGTDSPRSDANNTSAATALAIDRKAQERKNAKAEAPEPEPEDGEPPATPKRRPNADPDQRGGSGSSGNSPQKRAPNEQESAGKPQDSEAGSASSGGAGAGGQGQSQSKQEQKTEPKRKPKKPKKSRKPKKQGETKAGDDEQSSSNPSGSSQGGGKMSAVGNQRSGKDRGSDREDDPESDDEDVEDEKEESEARGGVMPMTRDRKQPPSRELGISGDGPPGDGRGGPTPPKKSRGTASLVLGIKLPDQVRGQPNPGTAKTSIEQIPPKPSDRDPRAAAPAASGPSSKTPQSRTQHDRRLAPAVQRYHELLRHPEHSPKAK